MNFGRSSAILVGHPIFAVSSPLGILDNTLSNGIVSGIRDLDGYKVLQISCPISKGSSGGPVFNQHGEVIGVAVFNLEGGQNLNFAVPGDYVKGMMAVSNQPKGLDALRGEASKESEAIPNPSSPSTEIPKSLQASVGYHDEIRKAGLAVYLERQLGKWSPEDTKVVLGQPLNHRYGYDQNKSIINNIFAFKDPTSSGPNFELVFNVKTEKMVGVYLYPVGLTWENCKKMWGDEVTTLKNPDGSKFLAYKFKHINVLLSKENRVLNVGIY